MLVYRGFKKISSHPDHHLRAKEVHLCWIQVTSTLLPVLSPFHRVWIAKVNMSDPSIKPEKNPSKNKP